MRLSTEKLPQATVTPKLCAAIAPQKAEEDIKPEVPQDSVAELPNTRETRINHFVAKSGKASLEYLRYLSTIYAANLVGSTVGSLIFTPIGISLAKEQAAVVGGFGIGGAVAGGALAALGGYFYERHRDKNNSDVKLTAFSKPGGISDSLLSGAALMSSMPKIAYPTIYGATPEQRRMIYSSLDTLPLKDVTASQTMTVVQGLEKTGIGGMSQPLLGQTRILFDNDNLNSASFGPELVIHEQAHAVDYKQGFGLLGSLNWRGGFGKGPFVSEYAAGNRYEDFAESYHAFQTDPEFAAKFPEKAAVLQAAAIKTPSEQLVDRPQIREVGKKMGESMSSVPYLRNAVELGMSLVSPLMIHKGSVELESGLATDDPARLLQGKMNLATGLMLAMPGGAPFALGTTIAYQALLRHAHGNEQKLQQANNVADVVLGVSTGPVGMAAFAVGNELKEAGIDLSKANFRSVGTDTVIKPATMLKGLVATVGGSVAGSLLGVTIGSALTGPSGAAIGALWGRVGGGLLGLGAYGALSAFKKDPNHETSPYDLTRDDKVFLGKVVGGGLTGAAIGTVIGSQGGKWAGEMIGQSLGGPTGKAVGAWVGGLGGTMIASYGLAAAGASIGRSLDSHPESKNADKPQV